VVRALRASVSSAIDVLRATPEHTLTEPRRGGPAGLPSTVLGLLFHAAEHTRRHAGQAIVTAKVARAGLRAPEEMRSVLLDEVVRAWEDAGVRGLCGEGRFEAAVGAARLLDPRAG
jgi:uncharacterized damage-inducible protein DinB